MVVPYGLRVDAAHTVRRAADRAAEWMVGKERGQERVLHRVRGIGRGGVQFTQYHRAFGRQDGVVVFGRDGGADQQIGDLGEILREHLALKQHPVQPGLRVRPAAGAFHVLGQRGFVPDRRSHQQMFEQMSDAGRRPGIVA